MTTVAIDFGTSNTVVCALDPLTQRPVIVQFPQLSRTFTYSNRSIFTIPSQVVVQDKDQWWIGEVVRSQRLGFAQPDRFFQGFKRDIGARFRPPARLIGTESYDAETIGEGFLGRIWQALLDQGIKPTQVILTVPVGAFEPYLDWLTDVSKALEFPHVQFVDESTAAALGYAIEVPGAIVLVVDFGGGTLDLSLVRTTTLRDQRRALKAEVIAKSDAFVGGLDVDTWIAEFFLRQWDTDRERIGELGWLTLLELAERLKITLSTQETALETWFDDERLQAYEMALSRDAFTELLENQQLLEQLRQALDEILSFAQARGIAKQGIERVLLVGGSCQIPAVQQLVQSYFGRNKVALDKTLTAVAEGALTLATKVKKLDDFLRHSYAIRLWEPYKRTYSYLPLFEKGTSYPCKRPDPLILQAAIEGQKEIRLDIGELADTAEVEVTYDALGRMTSSRLIRQADFRRLTDRRPLSFLWNASQEDKEVCIAHLQPPGQIGVDRVEVCFEVNEQRMLLATIKDLLSQELLAENKPITKLE